MFFYLKTNSLFVTIMNITKNRFFSNLVGGLLYMAGDIVATLISGNFSFFRALCVFTLGAVVYAIEIQWYFNWIERYLEKYSPQKKALLKTIMALLYFNPIWIYRHLALLNVFSGTFIQINEHLFTIAFYSFLVNIPISMIVNYLIQNKTPLSYRFLASALFSGVMAVYYSMSADWF